MHESFLHLGCGRGTPLPRQIRSSSTLFCVTANLSLVRIPTWDSINSLICSVTPAGDFLIPKAGVRL